LTSINLEVLIALSSFQFEQWYYSFSTGSVFWVGVFFDFFVCVGLSAYLACLAVEEYTGEPMSFKIQGDVNINHAPYPGVTVVGTNTVKQSGIEEAKE